MHRASRFPSTWLLARAFDPRLKVVHTVPPICTNGSQAFACLRSLVYYPPQGSPADRQQAPPCQRNVAPLSTVRSSAQLEPLRLDTSRIEPDLHLEHPRFGHLL